MKQQRRHARIQWLFPATYKALNSSNRSDKQGWGIIRNISLHGVEFATRFPIGKNDMVSLSFKMGHQYPFQNVPSKVLRIQKQGIYYVCGMEFDEKFDTINLENAISNLIGIQG